jgi:hypothetical protein
MELDSGFSLAEVSAAAHRRHWLCGGFPLSFLASSDADSLEWRKNFTQTFLERDLLPLGVRTPTATLLRFWTMLAHYHGQVWNAAEPARSLGISEPTARRYLDSLDRVVMVRQHARAKTWVAELWASGNGCPSVQVWDAMVLASAAQLGCRRVLLVNRSSPAEPTRRLWPDGRGRR